MTTIGSLCSGYAGLDLAAEQITGGRTVWHCEFDDAPSALLALRFPGVPNYRDLKTLEWAEHPVDVLTAGYPCQPFSGAGKRLGTDDPRHLFPYIAQGVERMRPELLLFENVRGHLTLGFDVVLAELDRIGYDVRHTLLRAADVGAPHGRSRLWIACRDREAGGWPAPTGEPTAVLEDGEWVRPQGGLFGNVAAAGPGTAGTMVRGVRWDSEAAVAQVGGLLPTPRSNAERTGRDAMVRDGHWSAPSLEQALELGRGELPREFQSWDEVPGWQGSLMPTPRTTDGNGAGTHGTGGPDLRTAVSLLPTPTTQPQTGNGHARDLGSEVKALLPTPTCGDAVAARNSTSGRTNPDSKHHSGDTLTDLVHDGRLFPTPKASDGEKGGPNQRGSKGDLTLPSAVQPHRLLPTPVAGERDRTAEEAAYRHERGKLESEGTGGGRGPDLTSTVVHQLLPTPDASPWGPYAAAVARWEAITRLAPPPTEQGRSGPRLSPAFVEWMQGLPAGWVTGPDLGLNRNAQLKMLGNGVVSQCAAVAYRLLLGDLLAARVAA